ncbi:MAG: NrfD/PsrC family molybdoenzyme membrane anchor subunit [Candidatus Rokuibacteriota bacterium]
MDPIVLMQDKWSGTVHVPLYLFFGGLTAGTFIVAVLCDLVGIARPPFKRVSRLAAYAAVPMLALAGFFLTFHLGRPVRGLLFPFYFSNYDSWMTWGGWIVTATAALLIAYAALWFLGMSPAVRRIVGVVGIPAAAGLAMYTGALLAGAGFVPLWSMQYLPLLFLNSGLTTGIAAIGLIAALAWPFLRDADDSPRPVVTWLSVALIVMIVIELAEIYLFMSYLAADPGGLRADATGQFVAPTGGRLAYDYVTQGPLRPWFWWGIIGAGLLVPLALTVPEFLLRRWSMPIAAVKFALVLIGGFMLRYVIVRGGDLKAPLPFAPQLWGIPG